MPEPAPPRQGSSSKALSRKVTDYDSPDLLRSALRVFTNGEDEPGSSSSEQHPVAQDASDITWIAPKLNKSISVREHVEDEAARLEVLKSYMVLDAEKDQHFERITGLASRIFDVPIALISLVDFGRQWFLSQKGLGETSETHRNVGFCPHAILSKKDFLIVEDAEKDPRFAGSPLVAGPPHIRFYAGAPLISPEGYKLGTVCIIDRKPKPEGMSLREKQNLRELAGMVMDDMVQWKQERLQRAEDKKKLLACTAHDLLTPLCGVQLSLSLLADDEKLKRVLGNNEKDLIEMALTCSDAMNSICRQAIENFRDDVAQSGKRQATLAPVAQTFCEDDDDDDDDETKKETPANNETTTPSNLANLQKVELSRLLKRLGRVMEPYPKQVKLKFSVDPNVPKFIITDEMKVFRGLLNYLTNACKYTSEGSICLRVYTKNKKKTSDKNGDEAITSNEVSSCVAAAEAWNQSLSNSGNFKWKSEPSDALTSTVIFECHDTGTGVDESMVSQLFQPLQKQHSTSSLMLTDDFQGEADHGFGDHGLGLLSVANHVSSLGGEFGFHPRFVSSSQRGVSVESADAETTKTGSVFWFSLPLHLPKDEENASLTPPVTAEKESSRTKETAQVTLVHPVPSSTQSKRLKIRDGDDTSACRSDDDTEESDVPPRVRRALVIDDSPTIRKMLCRALVKDGFVVSQARDGMEGLAALQGQIFDVVFCDFLMPIMDGFDCVQQYRAWEEVHRAHLPQYIIGISAHASGEDFAKGQDVGMNDCMPKPIHLKKLKEVVRSPALVEVSKAIDAEFSGVARPVVSPASTEEVQQASLCAEPCQNPACLIAEDSPSISKLMARAANTQGWSSTVVSDGNEALSMMKKRNWDAIFLDDQMPFLNGTECISQFREWESQNRVARQNNVYLASAAFSPNMPTPAGFDGALGKPVLLKELADLLQVAADNSGCKILIR